MRVSAFVDGFNLYHAVDALGQPHLKWLNLRTLCEQFAPRPQFDITGIYYFSAFATWLPDKYRRHREYVKALKAVGVTPIMGKFKPRDRECLKCGHQWQHHEEKQTDVNIALYLLLGAARDWYDRALLVTADSDLVPAIQMVRQEFPNKRVQIIAPVGRKPCAELFNAAGGNECGHYMERSHIEQSLFGAAILDSSRAVIAHRPCEYEPPPKQVPVA